MCLASIGRPGDGDGDDEQRQQERAEDGADDRGGAAGDAVAAEHHRPDACQQKRVAELEIGAADRGGEEHAGQPGQRAADHVGEKDGAVDGDPGEVRRAAALPDRQQPRP